VIMICDDCTSKLIEYRYRELDDPTASAMAEHLATCGVCAVAYCRLDADLSGILATVTEAPPASVHRALRAKVAREVAPNHWARMKSALAYRIPAYQATLVAAAILLAWFALNPSPEPIPTASRTVVDAYDASAILVIDDNVL